jgi:L1 cell adhesion molecule like protein
MSVFGLDFGSHAACISLWYEDKDKVEVIADDLGFRAIPCAVAFRVKNDGEGYEILTGQAAVSQAHKNPNNTFLDVRSLIMDESKDMINVPAMNKEISVTELASHFFRNVHNQIKAQVGAPVRDCVVSVPAQLCADGPAKTRLIEAAKEGGCRIKSTIDDASAVMTAHGLDDKTKNPMRVVVADMGWSSTTLTIFDVSGGMYHPKGSSVITEVCGKVLVEALVSFCVKDFMRKCKVDCSDYKKSMVMLRRECENGMRSLSTGSEAMIDIDSLCEGMDYSAKISKPRFEDMCNIPLIHLKKAMAALLEKAGVEDVSVSGVLMAGGLSGVPKCAQIVKSLFPKAEMVRTRSLDQNEAQCYGAALQGSYLITAQILDKAPAAGANPKASTMQSSVEVGSGDNKMTVFQEGTVLPAHYEIKGSLTQADGAMTLFVSGKQVGELVFACATMDKDTEEIVASIDVSEAGELSAEVKLVSSGDVLTSLTI